MKADKKNNYHYNKELKSLAKSLRNKMTKAEVCLWKYALSARQMKGYTFRRQRPVLNYIADFMCPKLKIIIEVDGITHDWEGSYSKDLTRQAKLEEAGFKVLRFSDDEVLNDIDNVILVISGTIESIIKTK